MALTWVEEQAVWIVRLEVKRDGVLPGEDGLTGPAHLWVTTFHFTLHLGLAVFTAKVKGHTKNNLPQRQAC